MQIVDDGYFTLDTAGILACIFLRLVNHPFQIVKQSIDSDCLCGHCPAIAVLFLFSAKRSPAMNDIMKSLGLEHKGLGQILELLQNKLRMLKEGTPPNFNLIDDAIHYVENHASVYHHPKEDVIYQYIIDQGMDVNGEFSKIIQEHHTLAQNTHKLKEALDAILLDIVVPNNNLVDLLDRFIEAETNHLNNEEAVLFPLIEELLGDEDWSIISPLMPAQRDDPIFGRQVKKEYQELCNRLAESASG